MITVAIVFPVFNGLAYTKKGLKALYERFEEIKDPSFSFKVIIVDDGSKDGTGDWIREHYPQVKLLEGSGNLWWSGGINKALQAGLDDPEIDYFIWWNNDIIPDENYFRNVCELLKGHDTGTVYGSKIYLDDQYDTIWSMGGLFDPVTGRKSMIGTATKDGPAFEKPQECDWLTGMGTITHRSVYEKIGLLDEGRFPQYHGDSDFTFRAKKAGFKVMAIPGLKIYNDTRNSGLRHDESFNRLMKSLFSIKSNFNIKKDFQFYRKHATSMRAYGVPAVKYMTYVGGYFKWKVLGFFGMKRKTG